jgi:hypothetical protein
MFKEFAIEPSLMAEWESFRELRDKFGIFQGRFIADFPRKKWKKMVASLLAESAKGDHPVRNSATMLAWLQSQDARRDTRFSRRHGPYDDSQSWVINALAAQDRFDAFITTAETQSDKSITWDEMTPISEHPLFTVNTQPRVARRGSELLQVIKPLLGLSTQVRWVDRYLSPDRDQLETVLDCLQWIRQESIPIKGFELHLGGQDVDFRIQQQNYRRVLGDSIPDGLKISLHWWAASSTENIHPRFVLTDIGGLQFDHGTDPGLGTSIVHLLIRTRWQEELQRYQTGTTDLESCGSLVL